MIFRVSSFCKHHCPLGPLVWQPPSVSNNLLRCFIRVLQKGSTSFQTLIMFFTLGMTADAAAAHRHEFSTPYVPAQHNKSPSPGPMSALLPPAPISFAANSISDAQQSRPVSSSSTQNPRSHMGVEVDRETLDDTDFSIVFPEGTPTSKKRKKDNSRSRTSFQIAHPAPVLRHRQRLKIRPRILLQLQQLSESSRPAPALDVVPSVLFAPRLAQKFPRMRKGRDGLGTNDLVVVSSEAYDTSPPNTNEKQDDSDDESWEHREVVATICQLNKEEGGALGKVEICLNHGPSWEATPLLNGAYEFVAREDNGVNTVARWVPRTSTSRRRSNTLQNRTTTTPAEEEKKFNFSIINPHSRRHPIIATITRKTIEISDRYPSPSSSMVTHPPRSPLRSPSSVHSAQTMYSESSEAQSRTMFETDEQLRTLIVVTGIWVVFRENWSQNFRYSDVMSVPLTSANPDALHSHRILSLGSDEHRKRRSFASDDLGSRHTALHNLGGKVCRTSTQLLQRSIAPIAGVTHNAAHDVPRQRAHSTGAAFIERANSRRKTSTEKANAVKSTSTSFPGDSDREKAAKARIAETVQADSSVTYTSGSSTPESTTVSEKPWNATALNPQIEGNDTTAQSSTSNTSRRRLCKKGYITEGGGGLRDEGRKRTGKLNRLFNIVRRTSGIPQH